MELKDKLVIYKNVAMRPVGATSMLLRHGRTLNYLWEHDRKSFWNHLFVTYFIRGEDCGKGVLDPMYKLSGWAPFLWDIEMETTTACYGKCVHCEHTYWKDKSYLNQHLTLDSLKKVLNSTPNLKWINLTGEGTSILNPEFNDMVSEVKNRGIYLDLSHDFNVLDEATARRWIFDGVDRIYWSIDGCTKATYESVRPNFDFERVCQNVQKLVELKRFYGSPLPEICFRYTFFNKNVHEVALLPDLLASLVKDVKDYGDEPSINIVALLEFDETKDWAVEIPQEDVDLTDVRSRELGFTNYWSHVTHIEEEKAPMDYCTFWSEPYIMITGHVVPCCGVMMSNAREKLEQLAFGNINEQSMKDIWNNAYYKEFRKRVVNPHSPVPQVCVGCRAFNSLSRAKKYGVWKKNEEDSI
jgi:MoaA/NifB/PqqE/SkfB family radical SAM enzyme